MMEDPNVGGVANLTDNRLLTEPDWVRNMRMRSIHWMPTSGTDFCKDCIGHSAASCTCSCVTVPVPLINECMHLHEDMVGDRVARPCCFPSFSKLIRWGCADIGTVGTDGAKQHRASLHVWTLTTSPRSKPDLTADSEQESVHHTGTQPTLNPCTKIHSHLMELLYLV